MGNVLDTYHLADVALVLKDVTENSSDHRVVASQLMDAVQQRPKLLTVHNPLVKEASLWHCAAREGNLGALSFFAQCLTGDAGVPASSKKMAKLKQLLNCRNVDRATPLILACKQGHAECVSLLVRLGADPWKADSRGYTAMHHAARSGHASCIRAIMDNLPVQAKRRGLYRLPDAPVERNAVTALHMAAAYGHELCAEVLLGYGTIPIPRTRAPWLGLPSGCTPLHAAAALGRTGAALEILKHQARTQRRATPGLDARIVPNSLRQLPYHVGVPCLQRLLHPHTSLEETVSVQAGATQVPKLSNIAAAALQAKLLSQLQPSSGGHTHCTHVKGSVNVQERESKEEEAGAAVKDDGLCDICFDRTANVHIPSCAHRMCGSCAEQLCSRIKDKPLACPFCRVSIESFCNVA